MMDSLDLPYEVAINSGMYGIFRKIQNTGQFDHRIFTGNHEPMVITPKYWGRSTPGSGKNIFFPMGLYGDIEKIYVKLTIVTSL